MGTDTIKKDKWGHFNKAQIMQQITYFSLHNNLIAFHNQDTRHFFSASQNWPLTLQIRN